MKTVFTINVQNTAHSELYLTSKGRIQFHKRILSSVGKCCIQPRSLHFSNLQDDSTIQLAFIPENKLTRQTIGIYNDLCNKSRHALWKQTTLSHDSTCKLIELTECISTDLNLIHVLTLENILTLSSRGDSVCLVELKLFLQAQNKDNEHVCLLSCMYDINRFGKSPTLQDVEYELTQWFKSIQKNLSLFSAVKHGYIITDMTVEQINESKRVTPVIGISMEKRWESQNQNAFFKMATNVANLGFNVASSIIGKPNADRLLNRVEDATWDVLDTFSRVTEYSRDTTANVLEHPLSRPLLPFIPIKIRSMFLSNSEVEDLLSNYDSASHYLSQWGSELVRGPSSRVADADRPIDRSRDFEIIQKKYPAIKQMSPLTIETFEQLKAMGCDLIIRSRVFCHGVSPQARKAVWKYLLCCENTDASDAELALQYASIKNQWQTILEEANLNPDKTESPNAEPRSALSHIAPGDEKEGGSVISKIRDRKYRVEKDVVRTDRNVPYYIGTETDQVLPPTDEFGNSLQQIVLSKNLAMLRDILISYTLYDFELGYVQGMNDLLSPILFVFDNEVDSFWCFVSLMKRMKPNFKRDQSGMREKLRLLELLIKFMDAPLYLHMESTDSLNLFCCFRWLLVSFKREFSFDDILRLWESIWACPLTNNYDIFFAYTLLNKHRNHIMGHCHAFDETLRFINDLSGNIDVVETISRSEVLFREFQGEFGRVSKPLELNYAKRRILLDSTKDLSESDNEEDFVVVEKEPSIDSISPSDTTPITKEELLELLELIG